MPSLPKLACQFAFAFLLISTAAQASVVINLLANRLDDQTGQPVAAGTLIQLVNLGADGVFNPIPSMRGTDTDIRFWVTGDDQVLNIPFTTTVGGVDYAGDFASTAAFDLSFSTLTENASGRLNRVFIFDFGAAGLPQGTKLGIRWFPGLQASDLYRPGGVSFPTTQYYGEFTRLVNLRNSNNEFWISPGDGSSITFDSLVTADSSGTPIDPDPATAGDAKFFFHYDPAPEPASVALSLIGAAGLAALRRRRRI